MKSQKQRYIENTHKQVIFKQYHPEHIRVIEMKNTWLFLFVKKLPLLGCLFLYKKMQKGMDEPMINMLRVQLQKIYNVKIGDYDKAAELRKIETRIWQEFNDKKGHCHHAMDQIRIDMKHTSLFLIKFNKAEVKPLLVAEIEPENKSYAYYY